MWKNEAQMCDAEHGRCGAAHIFTYPAETSMDNAVTLKSYTQHFLSGQLPWP